MGPNTARIYTKNGNRTFLKLFTVEDLLTAKMNLNACRTLGPYWEISTEIPKPFEFYKSSLGIYHPPQGHEAAHPQQVTTTESTEQIQLPALALNPLVLCISSSPAQQLGSSSTTTTPSFSAATRSASSCYETPHDITMGSKLGAGGFGEVHGATCHSAPVALKLFKGAMTSTTTLQCGLHEFELLQKCAGPNIVQQFGVTTQGDDFAIILEQLECDLRSLIYVGVPSSFNSLLNLTTTPFLILSDILFVAEDAGHGIHWAHMRRVIHADIKPENFLLSDFGLGISIPPTLPIEYIIPLPGDVGTPAYLSPEIVQQREISFKSDMYSFGVLLCEILSGKPPYSDHKLKSNPNICVPVTHKFLDEIFKKNEHTEIPTQYRGGELLPLPLVNLIEHCLAKDPKKRPDSMDYVAITLRSIRFELLSPSLTARTMWQRANGPLHEREPVMPWSKMITPSNPDPILLSWRQQICDKSGNVALRKLSAMAVSQGML
ncbi:Dual specificity protein kinase [Pelomyxa schiedti]|nr:Dual specificity protein kinase [Pelomyxa schiedti]